MTHTVRKTAVVLAIGLAVAALALALATGTKSAPDTPAKPAANAFVCPGCDVLLVTVDAFRADAPACGGDAPSPTPRICELAAGGTRFERAYAPAPATFFAALAILSGSLVSNENAVDRALHYGEVDRLAGRLASLGYATRAFTDHAGFGDRERLPVRAEAVFGGFDGYANAGVEDGALRREEAVVDAFADWFDRRAPGRFFAWLHFGGAMPPFAPAPEAARRLGYHAERCARVPIGVTEAMLNDTLAGRDGVRPLDEAERGCARALYEAELYAVDAAVGRVVDLVRAAEGDAGTLIVVAGTHGIELGDRSRYGHERHLGEELIRVPLVVRRSSAPAAARRDAPFSTVWLAEAIRRGVQNQSFAPPGPVVARTSHVYGPAKADPRNYLTRPDDYALITRDRKLVLGPGRGVAELYDLAADPAGERDLGIHRATTSPLAAQLRAWIEDRHVEPTHRSAPGMRPSHKLFRRLRRLGYTL